MRIAESHGPRTRFDLVGLALVSAAMLGVVWGLVRGNTAGWSSAEVLTMLAAGTVLGVAFVAWERRAHEPMLPIGLFFNRAFSAANAATFLLLASLFSTVFFFAQYLQISLGYSPLAAGLRFLPWTLTLFVVAPLAGRLADRIGNRWLLSGGLALQGIGFAWVAVLIADARPYPEFVAALVLSGCGTCMALPSGQNAVMNSVPAAALGKASGVFNTGRQLGGVFGVAILAAVFAAHGSYASATSFRDGVAPAVAVSAGLALLGAMAAALLPRVARTAAPAPVREMADAHAD
jgi:MFS family permease